MFPLTVVQAPVYCTQGLESGTSVFSFDHTVHMYRNKIWAGRELLKVTFLNPDVLNSWGLTRDNILDWAKVWDVGNEKVPTFKQVPKASRADIRVLLSGNSYYQVLRFCYYLFCLQRRKLALQR